MPKSVPSFVDVFPCSYKVSNCSIFLGPFHLTLRVARITFDPAPVIGDYKTLLPVQDLVHNISSYSDVSMYPLFSLLSPLMVHPRMSYPTFPSSNWEELQ